MVKRAITRRRIAIEPPTARYQGTVSRDPNRSAIEKSRAKWRCNSRGPRL